VSRGNISNEIALLRRFDQRLKNPDFRDFHPERSIYKYRLPCRTRKYVVKTTYPFEIVQDFFVMIPISVIANSRLDLNPHQVDDALFALRSPLSRGVILADEVGLGKIVEV